MAQADQSWTGICCYYYRHSAEFRGTRCLIPGATGGKAPCQPPALTAAGPDNSRTR
jgi:hypothetical protein